MGKINKDISVKIPTVPGIVINRSDNNRVFWVLSRYFDNEKGYDCAKRVTIGYAYDETHMYPNDKFKIFFPSLWEEATQCKTNLFYKTIGLYATFLAICNNTYIDSLIYNNFGHDTGNAILDYSMYLISERNNTTELFSDVMQRHVLFSDKAKSDTFYSNLFNKKITIENILNFKFEWATLCRESYNIEDVWIVIDGSNVECQSKNNELAEIGYNKKKNDSNIVGITYAISENGLPITFDIYRGKKVDSKELKDIVDFLKKNKIKIKGVIVDRGYCNSETIDYLKENSIPFELMLKKDTLGSVQISEEFGEKIKLDPQFWIPGSHLFATQGKYKIFANSKSEDFITLFFDYENASGRTSKLLDNIYEEFNRVKKSIDSNKECDIKKTLNKFIKIKYIDNVRNVYIDNEALKGDLRCKGLYAIASSENETADIIYKRYVSRNICETQYSILKSQLGFDTGRVHNTESFLAKYLAAFITSIFRYFIEHAALNLKCNTNKIIKDVNLIHCINYNDCYTYIHSETNLQKKFFKELGCGYEILDEVVKEENNRILGIKPTPRHRKPGRKKGKNYERKNELDDTKNSTESSSESSSESNNKDIQKKKPGVTKGTKRSEYNKDGSLRKKPGPKPKKDQEEYNKKDDNNIPHKKQGVPKGTKRGEFNKDGSLRKRPGPKPKPKELQENENNINDTNANTTRKKTGVPKGTKRGKFNKDGSLRKRPGPKPKSKIESEGAG